MNLNFVQCSKDGVAHSVFQVLFVESSLHRCITDIVFHHASEHKLRFFLCSSFSMYNCLLKRLRR